jgi:hypothetical protein
MVNAAHALRDVPPPERQLEVCVGVAADGAAVIEVVDSGCGIPAHAERRLFEPFFTTKSLSEGTGLGLAVSRNIARSHGGDLRYEPRAEARGSRFILTLPAAQPLQPPALRVLWLGARAAALDALEAAKVTLLQRAPDDPNLREVVAQFEPTVLLGDRDALHRFHRTYGSFEVLMLVAGDDAEPGLLTLRVPFDLTALAWFASRSASAL